MRISDWSSDVCSSDLLENDRDAESQDDATLRQCCPRLPARTPMQCIETERIDHRVAEHVDRIRHQGRGTRSEEHTSELQSLMRISYAVFCLKKQTIIRLLITTNDHQK